MVQVWPDRIAGQAALRPALNPIFSAALEIEAFCRQAGYPFCFIGGLAVQRWGEPRQTQDVDLTIITGYGSEAAFVDPLLARFRGRLPDARDFALRYRVLLLVSSGGVPLDVALGAMPFEERAVERASAFDVGEGRSLFTCSAEDLVVLKAFAGRDRDWLDIDGIVVRQGRGLDTALIWRELEPLLELKDDDLSAKRLREILDRGGDPDSTKGPSSR